MDAVSPLLALLVLVVLVALTTAVGVVLRARAGRAVAGSAERIAPADLGGVAPFGTRATLVQFSTPTCAQCPGTARLLRGVAGRHEGVEHLEVDLARHPEVADRFGVLQTPTTLLLDAGHRVRARIGGAPRPEALETELETVLGGSRVH